MKLFNKLFNQNKKASILDLIVWIIISFIVILFLAVWIFAHGLLTTNLELLGTSNGVNYTDAAVQTFGQVDSALGGLHFVAFAIIFALGLSILISNFFIKANPVFFVVHVLVTILAIVFSVYVSNAYESLMNGALLGSTITEFTAASWIMLNLPLWTTVLGMIGAIVLFAGIPRDTGLGGSVI